jgi:hypothetical protein
VEKLQYVPYATKKCIRPVTRRKMIPVNTEAVLTKPIKAVINNGHSINCLLLFT